VAKKLYDAAMKLDNGDADQLAPSMLNEAAAEWEQGPPEHYVTLLQMGAIVGNTSKRTIRRMYDKGELPTPDIHGRKGSAHKWRWTIVRPILQTRFECTLPENFPADRFIR
jgi:hypothetical protein